MASNRGGTNGELTLYFLRAVKTERAMKEVLANEERREEAREASDAGRP